MSKNEQDFSEFNKSLQVLWEGTIPRDVEFTYKSYESGKTRRRLAMNQVLSSPDGRFYLSGLCRKNNEIRKFNLYSIVSKITVNGKKYDAFDYLNEVLGIETNSSNEVIKAVTDESKSQLRGCLVSIISIMAIFYFIGADDAVEDKISVVGKTEPTAAVIEKNIIQLSDKNINNFLHSYSNDYTTHAMRLVRGFKKYKDNNDYQGFAEFKNSVWFTSYQSDAAKYDNILENNRQYLFNNGLTFLFSNLTNLSLRANDLFFDLKNRDKTKRKQASSSMKSDMQRLVDLFKEKGLELKPLVRN